MAAFDTARGVGGSISGAVGTSGTLRMKVNEFSIVFDNNAESDAGFGDGGNDSFNPGVNTVVFSANGWIMDGTALGTNFTGTNYISASITLLSGQGGPTWTGTALVTNFRSTSNYKRANVPCSCQGVFLGGVTES